jgi:HD superfamily phosphohydrolase
VQSFVHEILDEYAEYVRSQTANTGLPFASKDIFDVIWGSVELSSEEICLLDSPLIQRLRRITQLGFAGIVYCNANYSRFCHTLGVIEIAGRMSGNISTNSIIEKSEVFNFINIVRVAALFHDSGHTFFSHVSESYFVKNTNGLHHKIVNEALTEFRLQSGAPKTKLHELLSIMIVNSRTVCKLLELIGSTFLIRAGAVSKDVLLQVVEYISGLIIGIPCDRVVLPYSSIINGPIDADKIDYLSRDSACTKVPIAVDVARLIQKLTIVNLKVDQFKAPPVWNAYYDGENKPFQALAVRYSARKACWQLYMARSIMFESVYYHHKKLSAETMFRNGYELFESLFKDTEFKSFSGILSIEDNFFNERSINLAAKDTIKPEVTKQLIHIFKRLKSAI